jgi:hypothetical protein
VGTTGSDESARRLYDRIVAKARDDAAFRKTLLAHPRKALERELHVKLPKDLDVRVEEGRSGGLVFTTSERPTGELTDAQVATVAGGSDTAQASVSDMSEMDKLDLQEVQASASQVIQALSGISRMEHDAAKAIINNLRS